MDSVGTGHSQVHSYTFQDIARQQQSGAVEACWAHNPEVRGSKPRSASILAYNNV